MVGKEENRAMQRGTIAKVKKNGKGYHRRHFRNEITSKELN